MGGPRRGRSRSAALDRTLQDQRALGPLRDRPLRWAASTAT
ncbi:hypothetical protein I553_5824 [Mycobacterium xenopi 4042]|uniref:Uncharacterized protein n=1 Tax=Mycobacterium xenopi 4042 TaxID=1299334 RepID=X7ZVY0_MYCXE|nr:hypothetical protein I553_5824 [Mycobacterium xenopi 4042]